MPRYTLKIVRTWEAAPLALLVELLASGATCAIAKEEIRAELKRRES